MKLIPTLILSFLLVACASGQIINPSITNSNPPPLLSTDTIYPDGTPRLTVYVRPSAISVKLCPDQTLCADVTTYSRQTPLRALGVVYTEGGETWLSVQGQDGKFGYVLASQVSYSQGLLEALPEIPYITTPTPEPIFITLGSPFAPDCGNGKPVIWSNSSFNAPWRDDKLGSGMFEEDWGHMDMFAPEGCNIDMYAGEVIAPVPGIIIEAGPAYTLQLPDNTYPTGILEALQFAGVSSPGIGGISNLRLNIGHVASITGQVVQGQTLGDIVWAAGHPKIAYQVFVLYNGIDYALSPTLFPTELADGTLLRPMLNGSSENWICALDSYARSFGGVEYGDCVPEPFDYAP